MKKKNFFFNNNEVQVCIVKEKKEKYEGLYSGIFFHKKIGKKKQKLLYLVVVGVGVVVVVL
jgi:hypothetical protein